jgi:hypothetical protein
LAGDAGVANAKRPFYWLNKLSLHKAGLAQPNIYTIIRLVFALFLDLPTLL